MGNYISIYGIGKHFLKEASGIDSRYSLRSNYL